MSDLERLRSLGVQLRPPPFESLVVTARRRTRRAAAVVAACTAVVLVIGGGALRAGSDDRSAPGPANPPTRPTQTSEPGPSEPTYSPRAGEVFELPQGRTRWATMRQGRYQVQATPTLAYHVDVPDLWTVLSGRFLNAPAAGGIFLLLPAAADQTVLPERPCRDHLTTRVAGPTVNDLAGELRSQPILEVTEPVPVTLDGYRGLYLEVRIPDEFVAASCDKQKVELFSSGKDGWAWEPGYVGRWWILDVDGERVVVMPQCDTGCTEDEFATLTTMAESITFTPDE